MCANSVILPASDGYSLFRARFRFTKLEFSLHNKLTTEVGSLRDELAEIENCTERYSSEFNNNCFTEMRSGSEEGSYSRLIDCYITQL